MKQRYPGTQAVARAVALLKAVAATADETGLGELSRRVGLNKATAHRLLAALLGEGLLERGPAEGYRLGPELLALGSRAFGASGLRAAAHGELAALAHATRETVTLEVLVGDEVLIVDEVLGGHVVGTAPSVGTRWPAHATSTGKVLLALGDGARGARTLVAATSRTLTEPAALLRELARVRARGFAVSAEELESGFVAVGAPVRAADGRVVAAISVGGPKMRFTAERVRDVTRRLLRATARVSERLGHKAEGWPAAGASRKGRA